jgi:hypothetical protein
MPLTITGTLSATIVEHTDPALPANTPVPARRETIEALGNLASFLSRMSPNGRMLLDGELRSLNDDLEILRRFILTR